MPGNFKKDDLRIQKTHKALHNALTVLLKRRKFKQLTVNDLCEEALISRAAFYMHFKDKYDLLERWFEDHLKDFNAVDIEDFICRLVYDNAKIMQNIIYNAENETLCLLHNFIRLTLDKFFRADGTKKEAFEYTLLSTFCDGGVYEIILCLLKSQQTQSEISKKYLHNLLKDLLDFHNKYDYK